MVDYEKMVSIMANNRDEISSIKDTLIDAVANIVYITYLKSIKRDNSLINTPSYSALEKVLEPDSYISKYIKGEFLHIAINSYYFNYKRDMYINKFIYDNENEIREIINTFMLQDFSNIVISKIKNKVKEVFSNYELHNNDDIDNDFINTFNDIEFGYLSELFTLYIIKKYDNKIYDNKIVEFVTRPEVHLSYMDVCSIDNYMALNTLYITKDLIESYPNIRDIVLFVTDTQVIRCTKSYIDFTTSNFNTVGIINWMSCMWWDK